MARWRPCRTRLFSTRLRYTRSEPSEVWKIAEKATPDFFDWLHGFSWLEDLAAHEDAAAARVVAEEMVRNWASIYVSKPRLSGR